MNRILPAKVDRKKVIRYLRETEHKVIDILDGKSRDGSITSLNKDGLSYMFDNICRYIYEEM